MVQVELEAVAAVSVQALNVLLVVGVNLTLPVGALGVPAPSVSLTVIVHVVAVPVGTEFGEQLIAVLVVRVLTGRPVWLLLPVWPLSPP